ncbi:hypothetical protein L207DRAFT_592578 [Hyaloscypha variabilis F]|uniref:C2H2-type domain-containing protein n=1 Tax=Hyaloscypha variabilis (strain UAMH 11265 / GT02V1 / F) TaxID=1149755 RepID=A0A2J6QW14_HYAVF|nr:hypothetical protein L207DRAFT_592578 [Hyaloscypha variabilis F]
MFGPVDSTEITSYSGESLIDPALLSIAQDPVGLQYACTNTFKRDIPSGFANIDSDVSCSLIPGSSLPWDQVASIIEFPTLPLAHCDRSIDSYDQIWLDNDFHYFEAPDGSIIDFVDQTPSFASASMLAARNAVLHVPSSRMSQDDQTSSPSSTQDTIDSPASTTSAYTSSKGVILCTWPTCTKSFPSRTSYNHHFLNHSRPFQCPLCTARHATKRHLSRHLNVHLNTNVYYCSVKGCERGLGGKGKGFRNDNCRRHLVKVHGFTAEEARRCVEKQEGEYVK